MGNKAGAEALKVVLADTFTLYLKTLNYHWNVESPNFLALHLMFEGQYQELATAVDDIAERIRALGEKAPATFSAYSGLSSMSEGDCNASGTAMVKDLAESQIAMDQSLSAALKVAQAAEDEGTIALLDDRIRSHEKTAWMLRSSAV